MIWLRIGLFAATCVVIATYPFVSSPASVALWLALFFGQFALVFWQWKSPRLPVRTLLVTAAMFRLLLLPAGYSWTDGAWQRFLVYDHDVWRFLWDGHVSASGVNPYAYPPSSEVLDEIAAQEPWPLVRAYVNYPDHISVYPPAAQGLFRLAHLAVPGSPVGPKLAAAGADLLCVALLPQPWSLLYAWNPLVLKAGAASGHVDSVLGLLLLLVARNLSSPWRAGFWFALSALYKLSPLVLLPWLWLRGGWRSCSVAIGLFALAWLPWAGELPSFWNSLRGFTSTWVFNSPPYALLLNCVPPDVARMALGLIFVLCSALLLSSRLDATAQAAWTLSALVLLSPALMPWYLIWGLPLALLARQMGPVLFTAPVGLAMLIMVNGREEAWWLLLEGLAFLSITAVTFPWSAAKRKHETNSSRAA